MRFGELLKQFKASEGDTSETMLCLVDDAILRNALLAWQSMVVEYDPDASCGETDPKRQWLWMWQHAKFNMKQFSVVAGLKKEYEAGAIMERLKALHLIYPDGTANTMARNYLRGLAKAKLPKSKKPEKKDEPEKPA